MWLQGMNQKKNRLFFSFLLPSLHPCLSLASISPFLDFLLFLIYTVTLRSNNVLCDFSCGAKLVWLHGDYFWWPYYDIYAKIISSNTWCHLSWFYDIEIVNLIKLYYHIGKIQTWLPNYGIHSLYTLKICRHTFIWF